MRISTHIRLTIAAVVSVGLVSSFIALDSAGRVKTDYANLVSDVAPFIDGIDRLRYQALAASLPPSRSPPWRR